MVGKEIIYRRMVSQGILRGGEGTGTPEELVGWMGCIQAQDFGQAKWAIGVRNAGVTEAAVDAAFDEGRILRTHVLRPTWHFVVPKDIRWMLALTAPRIRQFSQPYYKKLGIDVTVLRRSRRTLTKALEARGWLTRMEIGEAFRRAKIETGDIRMSFLLMDAEVEGLICSGPRRGKQFTYTLLEKRAPGAGVLSPEEAVAELAARYFRSRGPATVPDFAWWSGLTIGQAKQGWEAVKGELERAVVEGKEYWFGGGGGAAVAAPPVLLLPAFDEFMVAYKDRSQMVPAAFAKDSSYGLKPALLVDGIMAGTWKRTIGKNGVELEVAAFEGLRKKDIAPVKKEARRYAAFAGRKLVLSRS